MLKIATERIPDQLSPAANFAHHGRFIYYRKLHLVPVEREPIDPVFVVVVGGARVLGQHLPQLLHLFGFQPLGDILGDFHVKLVVLVLLREPLGGLRVAVGGEQVGFDIVDGSAVHKVGTAHKERRVFGVEIGLDELHAGETDGVGTEGRTRGEDAHTPVAAEPRGPHRRRPSLLLYLRENPDQPQMGELLDTAQRLRVPELGLEHDARPQRRHQPALPRNPEFRRELAADTSDDLGFDNLFVHYTL